MPKSGYLIIVGGSPGAGKSTLAKHIAARYGLMTLHKDGLKETLFDRLGWSDREWSKKVGFASYGVLYHVMEAIMSAGYSYVVESNFSRKFDLPELTSLIQRFGYQAIEVVCACDPDIAFSRFKQRVEAGQRHPGHQDGENLEEFQKAIEGWRAYRGLGIDGPCIHLDMSDFGAIDYSELHNTLDAALSVD